MFAALHMVYVKYIHWSTFYNMLQYKMKSATVVVNGTPGNCGDY